MTTALLFYLKNLNFYGTMWISGLPTSQALRAIRWQGRIDANESVKITTPHARFVYDYNSQLDKDQSLSGGTER